GRSTAGPPRRSSTWPAMNCTRIRRAADWRSKARLRWRGGAGFMSARWTCATAATRLADAITSSATARSCSPELMSSHPRHPDSAEPQSNGALEPAQRATLLRIARESIAYGLEHGAKLPVDPAAFTPPLCDP